jgi:hypothetical protein
VTHWTAQETEAFDMFLDPPELYGRKVTTRKEQRCVRSGRPIPPGFEVHALKVYPSSTAGRALRLTAPTTFYACGFCGLCTH